MEPSPKSLILDLLATVGRSTAPVRALIAAADLFEIGENRLRVALARLCADGLVESDGRGRYRLGGDARGAGPRDLVWDGRDDAGHLVAVGPYIAWLEIRSIDELVLRREKSVVVVR